MGGTTWRRYREGDQHEEEDPEGEGERKKAGIGVFTPRAFAMLASLCGGSGERGGGVGVGGK